MSREFQCPRAQCYSTLGINHTKGCWSETVGFSLLKTITHNYLSWWEDCQSFEEEANEMLPKRPPIAPHTFSLSRCLLKLAWLTHVSKKDCCDTARNFSCLRNSPHFLLSDALERSRPYNQAKAIIKQFGDHQGKAQRYPDISKILPSVSCQLTWHHRILKTWPREVKWCQCTVIVPKDNPALLFIQDSAPNSRWEDVN